VENQVVWVSSNLVGPFGRLRFPGGAQVVCPDGGVRAATGRARGSRSPSWTRGPRWPPSAGGSPTSTTAWPAAYPAHPVRRPHLAALQPPPAADPPGALA
jgi:hypothetical protein